VTTCAGGGTHMTKRKEPTDRRNSQEPDAAGMLPTDASDPVPQPVTRRTFLGYVGAGAAMTAAGGSLSACGDNQITSQTATPTPSPTVSPTPTVAEARQQAARATRVEAAEMAYARGVEPHPNNGDEDRYPSHFANFSKALPHDELGVVEPAAYEAYLHALSTGRPEDFENIPLGGKAKLANPQAGLAFDLEGPDSHCMAMPPAPRFDSAEQAGELVELYWMALARDVHFSDYATDATIAAACDDLSALTDFTGPKQSGSVTPATIFRGLTPGDLAGPPVSQFLLRDFTYGSLIVLHRQKTVVPNVDYLTGFTDWLSSQNGTPPPSGPSFDVIPRYIRNLRDLAAYVHLDTPSEAFMNACIMLLGQGVPVKDGNPYKHSATQGGFTTFGPPHIQALVGDGTIRALKAVWFQKWFVHRRLRPEEYAGRVHVHVNDETSYPVHQDVLNSVALQRVQEQYGSALLPQAYPEGCPTHPSYGAGHNAIAGACITLLKAWFVEETKMTNPVVASADGTRLDPYTGSDADSLTVGGELNKLAGNMAAGRDAAGIHWRSDYWESILLGERVALGLLEEQKLTFNEPSTFTVTKFDGTVVTI